MNDFRQERFILINEDELTKIKKNFCWILPITYRTRRQLADKNLKATTNKYDWFTCADSLKIVNIPLEKDEWILLNFPGGGT